MVAELQQINLMSSICVKLGFSDTLSAASVTRMLLQGCQTCWLAKVLPSL